LRPSSITRETESSICRAIAREFRAETSSDCQRNIEEIVAITVTNVTAETIKVAVKMNRLSVKDVKEINFFKRRKLSPPWLK
jgi:hypothetical protein